MPQRSGYAVGTGIATANHHHILVLSRDIAAIEMLAVEPAFCIGSQEIHGEVNTVKFPTLNGQISGAGSAPA